MAKYSLDTPLSELSPEDRDDESINILCVGLKQRAYGEIQDLTRGDTVLASFMVCCCFIEQMATYRYGTTNVGSKEFIEFAKEYLPAYDPFGLRNDLRNKLVHNYALGRKYALTARNHELHLEGIRSGKQVINLENFVADLGDAINRLVTQLRDDPGIKKNALKVMHKIHVISKNIIELPPA